MDKRVWPKCIRPSGKGLRIRLWKNGKCIHSETIECDPYSKADLKAAVKRRDELQSRVNLGIQIYQDQESEHKLFSEAAQEYLDLLEVKAETRRNYVGDLNRYWMPKFGNWMCNEIKEVDIKLRLAELSDVHWKGRKNAMSPLRGVLTHAGISPNPAAGVTVKRGEKRKIQRYTPDEREILLSRLNGDCKVYFSILFGCGLRPSEALALTWDKWDGERFYIDCAIVTNRIETTKTYQKRSVYVPTWVRPLINGLPSRFKGEWLFVNLLKKYHGSPETFNKRWKEAHHHEDKNKRIPYRHPYTCRHTRAAELLSSGSSRYAEMAQQMGHSLEMFLNNYSEFIEEYATTDTSIFEGVFVGDRQKTDKE